MKNENAFLEPVKVEQEVIFQNEAFYFHGSELHWNQSAIFCLFFWDAINTKSVWLSFRENSNNVLKMFCTVWNIQI